MEFQHQSSLGNGPATEQSDIPQSLLLTQETIDGVFDVLLFWTTNHLVRGELFRYYGAA